jgi:hypothetical protein
MTAFLEMTISLDGFVAAHGVSAAHVGLELTRTVETPGALHLRYRVARTV